MRLTKVRSPIPAPDWENRELGNYDGGTDGGGDFFGGLDAETDVAFGVTNDDNGLEAGALAGAGLLLDRFDLEVETEWVRCFLAKFRSPSPLYLLTFMTSSFSLGKKKSTIWYSLIGRECR